MVVQQPQRVSNRQGIELSEDKRVTVGAKNSAKIEFKRLVDKMACLSSGKDQKCRIILRINPVQRSWLNADDIASTKFAGGAPFIKSDVTANGVYGDFALGCMFRHGLTSAHVQQNHAVSGFIDQHFRIESTVVKFDQIMEALLVHSVPRFASLGRSYAPRTTCGYDLGHR